MVLIRFAPGVLLVGLLAAGASWAALDLEALVPEPDLARMEPGTRRQLQEARQELHAAAGDLAALDPSLLPALTQLGRLYLLYDLTDAAAAAFGVAQEIAPEDPRWSYLRGVTLEKSGDLVEAARSVARSLVIEPGYVPAWLRLGHLETERGELEAAEEAFRNADRLAPGLAFSRFGLGRIALAKGQPEAAARYFLEALERQPEASSLHYNLAQAHRAAGETDLARDHLAKRGSVPVGFPDPWLDQLPALEVQASYYLHQGNHALADDDFETAISAYRAALEQDPTNVVAQQALATALGRAGQLDEAIARFRSLARERPDDSVIHHNLASLLAEAGASTEALQHFERALELSPRRVDSLVNSAILLSRTGQTDAALSRIARAQELAPLDLRLYLAQGRILAEAGRLEAAAATLDRLQLDRAADAEVAMELADLYDQIGRIGKAEELYSRVADGQLGGRRESAARAHVSLGNLAARSRHFDEAADRFRRAVALDPDEPRYRLSLSRALAAGGDLEGAAVTLEELIEQLAANDAPEDILATLRAQLRAYREGRPSGGR